jgi:metacaspase-1
MALRALCVGINDYPGSDMDLAGCVNDAADWRAVLETRGYRVDSLLDADATRTRMIEGLRAIVGDATAGDQLVFTFSGHGSWLPDNDRDEPDARDEMMCPHDVMQQQYVLDDDLHQIFMTKKDGVRLYVISDSCHSGSVVRYAPGGLRPDTTIKARFLPPYMLARGNRAIERAIDRAVNTPAPTKQEFPVLLFSGCQDSEFSYDTSFNGRPNGAFTRTAINALSTPGITTAQAWYDEIRRLLPSQSLPQTPQLYGSDAAKSGPLF